MGADARPDDHDRPGLSRVLPCSHCGHDEHVMECQALIDLRVIDVRCPCRGIPVPGVYPPLPHASRFTA